MSIEDEQLLLQATGIYRWRGRTMGRTIFGTRLGTLLLTSHRLVFLSSGGNDAWSAIAWANLGFGPEPVANAATMAESIKTVLGWVTQRFGPPSAPDFSRLDKDGSLNLPLTELTGFGVTTRRFSQFLWVAHQSPTGQRQDYTFSNKLVIPGGAVWESSIHQAIQLS
jgi:hypothetical protein